MLPPLIAGEDKACFAVTEPNAGLDTLKLKTKAVRDGDRYLVSRPEDLDLDRAGRRARCCILARTTPLEQVDAPHRGPEPVLHRPRPPPRRGARDRRRWAASAVDSNQLFIDGLPVPVDDRIGEEGKGFEYILHGMNPERILIARRGGRARPRGAAHAPRAYAKERIVFDRPIGQNQAIQHPLAACWMALEAANLMAFKAASLYDAGKPCGAEANAAKYLAGEAGFKACETAVMTHGGMGYAKEFHVERYLRESLIARIAPVSRS